MRFFPSSRKYLSHFATHYQLTERYPARDDLHPFKQLHNYDCNELFEMNLLQIFLPNSSVTQAIRLVNHHLQTTPSNPNPL